MSIRSQTLAVRSTKARNVGTISGKVLSVLVSAFMAVDAGSHFAEPAPVVDAFYRLGFPLSLSPVIATLALVGVALYSFRGTALLGAVLLTAYLGGATAAQIRIGGPAFFSVLVGVLVWAGLILRNERLRTFLSSEWTGPTAAE